MSKASEFAKKVRPRWCSPGNNGQSYAYVSDQGRLCFEKYVPLTGDLEVLDALAFATWIIEVFGE